MIMRDLLSKPITSPQFWTSANLKVQYRLLDNSDIDWSRYHRPSRTLVFMLPYTVEDQVPENRLMLQNLNHGFL